MRPVVSAITAVAVLLHVLLGCCLHHGHAADLQNHETASAAKHCEHHGHSHHHTHSHAHSTPAKSSSQPCENSHEDCHENHCNFVLTGKTTFVPDDTVAMLPWLAIRNEFEDAPSTAESAAIPRGTTTSRLPLRLYLCHQAFLN